MPPARAVPAHPPFTGISARAYEHPADRAATATLQRIPFFDALVKKLLEFRFEREMIQTLLANAVRVGPGQLPELWDEQSACYRTLDIAAIPDLYVIQWPIPNAMALGAHKPTVLVQSSLVSMLDQREIRAVLAHEAGHVLSEHVRYRSTLQLLLQFTLPRVPVLGQAALQALRTALLAWFRAAELSSDRAAAIVLRDPLIPCRALMKMAGGGLDGLNVDAFIQQADEYVEWDDLFDRRLRMRRELAAPHPFPVRRVYELTRWVRSGDYDRIIAGDYVKRGEEPAPSAEYRRAVDHYTERFRELIERTGTSVSQLSKRVRSWLDSVPGDDGEHDGDDAAGG